MNECISLAAELGFDMFYVRTLSEAQFVKGKTARDLILDWLKIKGKKATSSLLIAAIRAADRDDLADFLVEMLAQEGAAAESGG